MRGAATSLTALLATFRATLARMLLDRRPSALNLSLLLAIAGAVAVLALRCEGGAGIEVELREPRPGIDEIRVDVGGAVARPGVVVVSPGDRVADAIERAGGFTADADRAAINQARRVIDQDHVVVPRIGERPPLIDINSADAETLQTLRGIGPVRAADIIASRETEGPFVTTDELLVRELLPESVYEQVSDLIDAR